MTQKYKFQYGTKETPIPVTLKAYPIITSPNLAGFEYKENGLGHAPYGVGGLPSGGALLEVTDSPDVDVTVEGVMGSSFSSYFGTVMRYVDIDNTLLCYVRRQGDLIIASEVGGVFTALATYDIPDWTNLDLMKIRTTIEGNTITAYYNDQQVMQVTDVLDHSNSVIHGAIIVAESFTLNSLDMRQINGNYTNAELEKLGSVLIDTSDEEPVSQVRTVNIFDLTSMKPIERLSKQFIGGDTRVDSLFIREGQEVAITSPENDTVNATLGYFEHKIAVARDNQPDKVYAVIANGQSNAVGTSARILQNPDKNLNGLLFAGVPAHGVEDNLVQDHEVIDWKYYQHTLVETHGYGFIDRFIENRRLQNDNCAVLWACNGIGGRVISRLVDPSQSSLPNGLKLMKAALAKGQVERLDVVLIGMTWDQGESDLNTDPSSYLADLVSLHNIYREEANRLTGQTTFNMYINGIGSENYFGGRRDFTEINNVLYQYCQDTPDAFYCTPKYYEASVHGSVDGVHYNQRGFVIQGEYQALVVDRVAQSQDARVLQPTAYSSSGNVITVAMNIPTPPLVFDTTLIPELQAYGVGYEQVDGTRIVPVVTIDGNNLLLDIGVPPSEGDKILWGDGDRDTRFQTTNIRDSQNIPSAIDGVILHNWLPCHYHTLQSNEV